MFTKLIRKSAQVMFSAALVTAAAALSPLIGTTTAEAHAFGGGGFHGGGFHGGDFRGGGFRDRDFGRREFRRDEFGFGGFFGGYPGYDGYGNCYLTVYNTIYCS